MKSQPFSVKMRIRSFGYAWEGILSFVRRDHNTWVHAVATVLVLVAATWVQVNKMELLALVFAIGFVWVAEMFNTCVERIMDFISLKQDAEIKFIKDLAAGAVLIAAITALAVGGIVFIPKLFIL
jgi:diacylglycerol kinase (ATP)